MNSNKSNQSTQTSEGGQENLIPELEERKLNYKRAALAQKKAGDINSAKDLLKNAKIIESAIERIRMGQKIGLFFPFYNFLVFSFFIFHFCFSFLFF